MAKVTGLWVALGVLVSSLVVLVAPPGPPGGTPASAAERVASAAESQRPNIVVVMADDMRVDDLRFAPRLRRLVARRGVTFQNAFSPNPLCCPARASFLTGVHAHRHRVWSHERPWGYQAFDDSRTIATSLRRAGYRTGFVGKYLNGYGRQRSQVSGGPSYRYVPRGWSDWRASLENPGVKGIHGGTYYYFNTPYNVNGRVDNRYRGRYQTTVLGDFSVGMARRFGRQRNPFFMYVNYVAPHHGAPREPDDPGSVADRRGRRDYYSTPARPRWVRGKFDRVVTRAAGLPRGGGPSERDVSDKPRFRTRLEPTRQERRALREVSRQRAESVFVMDQQIGRLVRTLKRTGEWSNTVFVFTSDNGYFQGEHRTRQGKVLGHEPSLRVPLLMTGPGFRGGRPHGRLRDDPATLLDLSATILDLANAKPPYRPDGSSRLTTLRRGDQGWSVPVLHESGWGGGARVNGFTDVRTSIGVRTARYALLRYRRGGELYDLSVDAVQNQSVWKDEDYRPVKRELLAVWRRLKDCVADECQQPLPDSLATDPAQTRSLTRSYWRQVDRVYGW
ncbi:sulfatase family protein [Nocardioides coralli]|uniref:sulfatase family protein n=1 Tax=Nocardioides coralli TaxID=2872154 RepID=UPI001CA38796|nr:sulfatase [Nocardioides coralli]QZY27646.1 sulfatase [Nocardioides coralli]